MKKIPSIHVTVTIALAHDTDRIFLFLARRPRRSRQIQYWRLCVAVTDGFAHKLCQCKPFSMAAASKLTTSNQRRPYTSIHMADTIVLALATLGGTTQIGSFLFLTRHPSQPRQIQYWRLCVAVTDSFAHKLCQCKWSSMAAALTL
jgi:hypothetical protein